MSQDARSRDFAMPPEHRFKGQFSTPFRDLRSVYTELDSLDLDGDARCERVTCETSNRLVKAVGSLTGGALPNRIPIENESQQLGLTVWSGPSCEEPRWCALLFG